MTPPSVLPANITSVLLLTVRHHTGQHVNIVICRRSGTVYRDKCLATKSYAIDSALNKKAIQINQSILVKSYCRISVLRVAGAKTSELPLKSEPPMKQIAIGIDVQRSSIGIVWNINRSSSK